MASRRNNLFSAYDASQQARTKSSSPAPGNGYGLSSASPYEQQQQQSSSLYRPNSATPSFGAYPNSAAATADHFRTATPNKKGQYSDAVLSELESQNDAQLEGMSAKVAMLKQITVAIGDEIRDSTALAEKMNDTFEQTRVRLRGTMTRMLRMAEKTGVSWKVWLLFFGAVIFLFLYVKWS